MSKVLLRRRTKRLSECLKRHRNCPISYSMCGNLKIGAMGFCDNCVELLLVVYRDATIFMLVSVRCFKRRSLSPERAVRENLHPAKAHPFVSKTRAKAESDGGFQLFDRDEYVEPKGEAALCFQFE